MTSAEMTESMQMALVIGASALAAIAFAKVIAAAALIGIYRVLNEMENEISWIRMEIESLEPDLEPAQAKNDPLNDPQAPAERAGSRALLVRIAEKRLRQRRSEAIE